MILVTGGLGYIGSHLVLSLLEMGKSVLIVDNLSNSNIETFYNLKAYGDVQLQIEDLHVCNFDSIFLNNSIEAVYHFASPISSEESAISPIKYYETVYCTIRLLDAMKKYNVNKIIFSSSAAVYGEVGGYIPIKESSELKPISPYGKAKFIIEMILSGYPFDTTVLRYFNVIGIDNRIGLRRNNETHLIPLLFRNKKITIYGTDYYTYDGTCIRDYVDIKDVTRANILALNINGTFNIGSGNGYTVRDIIDLCSKYVDLTIEKEDRRIGDISVLLSSISRANEKLNWSPIYSIEESIKSEFDWSKSIETLV